ncbi:MAG: hypothetical protein J6A57_04560 [Ruminococcus sp.]|nr:hypothetical protein [Ruminococcus sp.]
MYIKVCTNLDKKKQVKEHYETTLNTYRYSIKSISYSKDELGRTLIIIIFICLIITILCGVLVGFIDREMFRKEINDRYFKDVEYYFDIDSEFYAAEKAELLSQYNDWKIAMFVTFLIGFSITFIMSIIIWKYLSNVRKNKLKITDEHIIATGDKERTTILPYENIFSVSEGGIKGITLYTSIGKVTFHLIKNRNEIIKVVSQKIKHDKSVNIQ